MLLQNLLLHLEIIRIHRAKERDEQLVTFFIVGHGRKSATCVLAPELWTTALSVALQDVTP